MQIKLLSGLIEGCVLSFFYDYFLRDVCFFFLNSCYPAVDGCMRVFLVGLGYALFFFTPFLSYAILLKEQINS